MVYRAMISSPTRRPANIIVNTIARSRANARFTDAGRRPRSTFKNRLKPARPGGRTDGATTAGVAKISVSLDDELYERVRASAGESGVSGWLAEAASARLRADALLAVSEEIASRSGGAYSADELDEARRWLPSSSTPAR